jgi:hypothetical protein
MADRNPTVHALTSVWPDLGRRLAVAAAACVALLSIWMDCPLWVASLRGGATLIGMLCVVRVAQFVIDASLRVDQAKPVPVVAQRAAGSQAKVRAS